MVHFDKGRVLEFGSRVCPSPGGDRLKEPLASQLVQKLMPMALDRFDGLLQNEEHDDRKGQLPLPREVFRTHAMPRAELSVAKPPPQLLDEINDMSGKISAIFESAEFMDACKSNDVHIEWKRAQNQTKPNDWAEAKKGVAAHEPQWKAGFPSCQSTKLSYLGCLVSGIVNHEEHRLF